MGERIRELKCISGFVTQVAASAAPVVLVLWALVLPAAMEQRPLRPRNP